MKRGGKVFSRKPINDPAHHHIIFLFVYYSHSLTPDRYVLNKYNNVLSYQDLHEQTHHFVRATDGSMGVSKQALSKPHKGPVLSDIHLRVGVVA